jgi:hypothetical protein
MTDEDLNLVEQLKALIDERGIAWGGGPKTLKSLTDAVPFLVAEIRRLRGLIKEAELAADTANIACACPWCGSMVQEPHAADCPAFTEDGRVR